MPDAGYQDAKNLLSVWFSVYPASGILNLENYFSLNFRRSLSSANRHLSFNTMFNVRDQYSSRELSIEKVATSNQQPVTTKKDLSYNFPGLSLHQFLTSLIKKG